MKISLCEIIETIPCLPGSNGEFSCRSPPIYLNDFGKWGLSWRGQRNPPKANHVVQIPQISLIPHLTQKENSFGIKPNGTRTGKRCIQKDRFKNPVATFWQECRCYFIAPHECIKIWNVQLFIYQWNLIVIIVYNGNVYMLRESTVTKLRSPI